MYGTRDSSAIRAVELQVMSELAYAVKGHDVTI